MKAKIGGTSNCSRQERYENILHRFERNLRPKTKRIDPTKGYGWWNRFAGESQDPGQICRSLWPTTKQPWRSDRRGWRSSSSATNCIKSGWTTESWWTNSSYLNNTGWQSSRKGWNSSRSVEVWWCSTNQPPAQAHPRDMLSEGFRPPPPHDLAPPRGQIPRDLALPVRPQLGISPRPPLPNDTVQRIFLYLDLHVATKKASEIWFGNLFDNGFTWVRLRANVVWYFKSWSWLPSHRIRVYSFAAASLILLCLFNIAKFIESLVGDTSLRLLYIYIY